MSRPVGDRKTIWVCKMCGKVSPYRIGGPDATPGWDGSCFLNAAECYADAVHVHNGWVQRIPQEALVPT